MPAEELTLLEGISVTPEKSILITDPAVLDQISRQVDFGYLLGEHGVWTEEVEGPRHANVYNGVKRTPGAFLEAAFTGAYRDQVEHAALPAAQRLGDAPNANRMMDAVYRNWMSPEELRQRTTPKSLRNGPFRLLAVANLMDHAGDMSNSVSTANQEPKALGEMHLVYGLVDRELEDRTGRPFPQTFVLAYRIPPGTWVDGEFGVDAMISQHDLMTQPALWRSKMYQWAGRWAALSRFEVDDPRFAERLGDILGLITTPDNFLALRSNAKVNDREFELREWYVLQTSQNLIPKKVRNEPYRCLAGSTELAGLIDAFWSGDRADLDMEMYDPVSREPRGYQIFRDSKIWSVFDAALEGATSFSTCGATPDEMPYQMVAAPNGAIRDARTVAMAPFGRAVAGRIWVVRQGLGERKRHAFAIRTCSGCHSTEGVTDGFHIFPRLEGQASRLSPFLTGRGANTFTRNGATYRYATLQTRTAWLEGALDKSISLYESLLLPEVTH